MTKIYVDKDSGAEYEALPGESLKEGHFLIRPVVKQEPKWEVYLDTDLSEIRIVLESLDQAQLIKECCEKMMEYVMGGADFKDSYFSEVPLLVKARQAMKGDK